MMCYCGDLCHGFLDVCINEKEYIRKDFDSVMVVKSQQGIICIFGKDAPCHSRKLILYCVIFPLNILRFPHTNTSVYVFLSCNCSPLLVKSVL